MVLRNVCVCVHDSSTNMLKQGRVCDCVCAYVKGEGERNREEGGGTYMLTACEIQAYQVGTVDVETNKEQLWCLEKWVHSSCNFPFDYVIYNTYNIT